MSKKRILVLGGTGAMGRYLVPELISMGHAVDVVSLDDIASADPDLNYIKADVKNGNCLEELLKNGYNGIVDFMTYKTEEFRKIYKIFLENTDQYVFLSSCRVFADAPPITETSPRLLDVCTDKEFMATDDYALYKAREEDMLINSGLKNWTIVRPATTYSTGRFQLVTLEAHTFIPRMLSGKTVVLPEAAMHCPATLSWGGDVGKMIARLMFNPKAYGESYNVATSEHNTWEEIAQIYNGLHPLKYITVSTDDYLNIIGPGQPWVKYQLIYARMFRRITDNTKILEHTGMKQSELMSLRDGLKYEFEKSKGIDWNKFADDPRSLAMDEYLKKI